jgi:hypothetical protein
VDIPVFVSRPTDLSANQQESYELITQQLKRYRLEDRALGRSDYPTELPLREVLVLARHCSGGLILGFEQFRSLRGINKPGSMAEKEIAARKPFPTPWNHLEAGILFGLRLPLLIFREPGIEGGIFDSGVTDVFIHTMPKQSSDGLDEVFLKWQAEVRRHYYSV